MPSSQHSPIESEPVGPTVDLAPAPPALYARAHKMTEVCVARSGPDIYTRLVEAIEEGDLPPGTRLREAELAERYSVSRTPIREALKRLESQGLAVHEPNRGVVVAQLDHDQLNELYVIRTVLEGTVARLAAQHATKPEIELLQEMVENDRANAQDPVALSASNRAFHRRLTAASHNRFLVSQIEHMKQALLLLGGSTFSDPIRRQAAIDEHAAIVEAVAQRDSDAADMLARRHIEAAHKARLRGTEQA